MFNTHIAPVSLKLKPLFDVVTDGGRLNAFYTKSGLLAFGWLTLLFAPLVVLPAVGGQTADELLNYMQWGGIDVLEWKMAWGGRQGHGAFWGAITLLSSQVVLTFGLLTRSEGYVKFGSFVAVTSLLFIAWGTAPLAPLSLFGVVAVPHVGWWLLLAYIVAFRYAAFRYATFRYAFRPTAKKPSNYSGCVIPKSPFSRGRG